MDNIKPQNDEQPVPPQPQTIDHPPQPHPPQEEPVLASTNSKNFEFLYEVSIEKDKNQEDVSSSSMDFIILVKNNKTGRNWTVSRKYEDFEWLYQALKISLPGYLLPYFPSPSVLKYLQQKLLFFNLKERNMFLISQKYQLRKFIADISQHQILGFSQELRIFLIDDPEDYRNNQRKINNLIEQLNIHQNTALTLSALWQKSKSWFADTVPTHPKSESAEWRAVRERVERYSQQLFTLIQKICMFKRAKQDEINWKGPSSPLENVQNMQENIENGKPFGEILNAEMEAKLMLPLLTETKKEAQLRQMLADKDAVQALIFHLTKIGGNENRLSSLELWGVKFQTHFCQGWEEREKEWLNLVSNLDTRFRNIFQTYSKQLYKIWE